MKKIALLLSLCLLTIPASIFAKVSVTVTELTDAPGVYKMTVSTDHVYDGPLPNTEYSLFIDGDTYVNGEKYMENYVSQFWQLDSDLYAKGGIIIPSSYKTAEGEVAIKKIGDNAFKGLTKDGLYRKLIFTISEGIEEIGEAAFMDTWIEDIKLPASLKKIGDDAFNGCKINSNSLVIPSSDITIGERAFADCHPDYIRFGASSADGISASCFEGLNDDVEEFASNFTNIVVPSSAVESFAAKFPSLKDKYLFACDFPFEDIYVAKDNVASDPDATFIAYVKPYDEATLSELYEKHINNVEGTDGPDEDGRLHSWGTLIGQWYEGCVIYSEARYATGSYGGELYYNINGFQDLGESKYQLTSTDLGGFDFQCAMVLAEGKTKWYETARVGGGGDFDFDWDIKPKRDKGYVGSRYKDNWFGLHELAHIQVHIVDMTAETDIYLPKNQVQAAEEQVTVLWDNMPYGAGVRYEIVSQNAPQNAEVNAMPSNNPVYVNLLDAADGTIQADADAPVGSTAVLKATLIAPTGKELVSRNITIHVTDVVNGGEGMPGDTTGIETIEGDENGDAVYYNLNGMQISSDNLTPGLYIRRAGNKTEKVFVK